MTIVNRHSLGHYLLGPSLFCAGSTAFGRLILVGDPIRIGEINSYSGISAFTEPYRKGWQLAVENQRCRWRAGAPDRGDLTR